MYIYRKYQDIFLEFFSQEKPKGLILAGVVGCGKTTLIDQALAQMEGRYRVFRFSGDDVQFRQKVIADTRYVANEVRTRTRERSLVFIDEVQKCEEVFDAVKVAFDELGASFVISGSNPAFLNSVAKRRLQRRADFQVLLPLSLPEILAHRRMARLRDAARFREALFAWEEPDLTDLALDRNSVADVRATVNTYLVAGGLPLAHLAPDEAAALVEVRQVVERGFELLSVADERLAEVVEIELADLHSREFSFQGVMSRTGVRKRDVITRVIDELMHHGYLVRKKPLVAEGSRKSYLAVYSYIDPGIVTYLSGRRDLEAVIGARVEGLAHARLLDVMSEEPVKTHLHYFKAHSITPKGTVKYASGEIDFVVEAGRRCIPVEVKAGDRVSPGEVPELRRFIVSAGAPYGIVLYAGLPAWLRDERILLWPYWLV